MTGGGAANFIKMGKRGLWPVALVLAASLLPLILSPGMVWGDDMSFHCSRIVSLYEGLKAGVIFPGVYPEYFEGAGYGVGLFYPDFFLYLPATAMLFGLDEMSAYKLFMMLITVGQTLAMYFSTRLVFSDERTATISAIVYTLAPYVMTDLYYRSAVGECLALIFLPLVIAGMLLLLRGETLRWGVLALGMTGLVLSHIITSVLTVLGLTVALVVHLLIKRDGKALLPPLLKAVGSTLVLTAFFTLPFIEQYLLSPVLGDQGLLGSIADWAVSLPELILAKPGPHGDFVPPPGMGVALTIIAVLGVVSPSEDKTVRWLCGIALGIMLCATELFPWRLAADYFQMIQFPWRLYIFATVLIALASGQVLSSLWTSSAQRRVITAILMIVMVVGFGANVHYRLTTVGTVDHNHYPNFPGGAEYLPVGSDYGVVTNAVATSEIELKRSDYNRYSAIVPAGGNYELPLVYYPGYQVKLDGQSLTLTKSETGLLIIDAEAGGELRIQYVGTTIRRVSFIITGIGLVALLAGGLWLRRKRKGEQDGDIII